MSEAGYTRQEAAYMAEIKAEVTFFFSPFCAIQSIVPLTLTIFTLIIPHSFRYM